MNWVQIKIEREQVGITGTQEYVRPHLAGKKKQS